MLRFVSSQDRIFRRYVTEPGKLPPFYQHNEWVLPASVSVDLLPDEAVRSVQCLDVKLLKLLFDMLPRFVMATKQILGSCRCLLHHASLSV